MINLRKLALQSAYQIAHCIPAPARHAIAENPLIEGFFRSLSKDQRFEISAADNSYTLSFNPLYHGSMKADFSHLEDYEPGVQAAIVKYLSPGMTTCDVGANAGVMSFLMAKQVGAKGAVFAFEPDERNIACIEDSITANPDFSVQLVQCAVSSKTGNAILIKDGGVYTSKLASDGNASGTSVRTTRLDDFFDGLQARLPDLVKVDVEGAETEVVAGMTNILNKAKPVIICELHLRDNPEALSICTTLEAIGYRCSWIKSDDVDGNRQLLAVHPGREY
ncbi:MAG: FkbM family methyltransferase [Halieaceae bacterium]|jgi:FkbM family methyltransferase|nr:FkbM family methyltransferase [Halieaceae bacterium]